MNSIYHQATIHSATTTQAKAVGESDEPIVQTLSGLGTTILEYITITEAYVALDYQWHIISYNQQTTRLIPDYQKDLLGKNLWECFPEIVGSLSYHKCLEAAATGKTAQFETKARHLQKWFRIHILPSTECITIFLNDITAQKQSEEQLRFQANILQHIHDSVIVTDLQGIITYWSEGADRIFGFTLEEMIGQNIAMLFPELDMRQLAPGLQHIAGRLDYSTQRQQRRQDGTTIWIEVKVKLLRNEEGGPYGFIGIAKNISQRKLAEDQVRRSEERFRALIENSADAIGLLTAQGIFLYASPSTQRVLGYLPEELVGRNAFRELVHPDDLEQTRHVFAAILQEPGKSFSCDCRLRHKDGSWRWKLIKSILVRERNRTPLYIISVIQDITQFKELEQCKDEFIMHISHELRTPLTALSGFLQIINDFRSQLDESTMSTFLFRSLENCQELTLLVNEVLNVLQFRHDKKSVQVEALSLHFIMSEVIAQLGPRKEQEYQFQLDISEEIMVRANRQYLCQILRNLLSNVFKYAPKQTPVIINAMVQEGSAQETASFPSVTISIQDAGPGIPLAEQQQLFEKFSRLKRDLASPVRGTGLGLYICKHLVERMGGRIWVESPGHRGDGSRFCFTLPGNTPLPQEPTTF